MEKYRGYIIEDNDYPHNKEKFQYRHEEDTDGEMWACESIGDCKIEIDEKLEI